MDMAVSYARTSQNPPQTLSDTIRPEHLDVVAPVLTLYVFPQHRNTLVLFFKMKIPLKG